MTRSNKLVWYTRRFLSQKAKKRQLNCIRASPAVEGPQAEIQHYLASNGCKFRPGEAYVSSGEPRVLFEFKQKVDEKRRTLTKFRDIYINRAKYRDILHILAEFVIYSNSA
jgi:hypothetical protein